jgi:cytoskeletal protein CcmA (bactofilin family)
LFTPKRESAAVGDGRVDTIIGREAQLKGTVVSSGLIRIDGKIDGEIIHNGDIAIGESGEITANVKAHNVTVAGVVNGNIEATGRLEFLPTARVTGDLSSAALVIAEGAVFKGSSDMKVPEKNAPRPPRAPA